MLAYVHDLNPVLWDLWGPLKLRYYGLAYLLAFILGYLVISFLAKRKLWVTAQDKISDFIAMLAIFGVFLGGRLGYILFYDRSLLLDRPLDIFKVWEGGMASHGGLLGAAIFAYFYARKNKVPWLAVGDGICLAAPLGLMCGRIANFINGELFGRVAEHTKYAVKFPQAIFTERNTTIQYIQEACRDISEEALLATMTPEKFAAAVRTSPEIKKIAEQYITPRYPSQLYEAFLEGAVLFAIVMFIRLKFPKAPHGIISGVFFICYAIFRIIVEQFREPDSELILTLTKGQFYSTFMIVAGIAFILLGLKKRQHY